MDGAEATNVTGNTGASQGDPLSLRLWGAAPPSIALREMEEIGFRVIHLYGATETYGPAISCVFQPDWADLPAEARYANMARQGVAYPTGEDLMVADPVTTTPVPQDGTTVGEIMLRGNTVMKGYLANPEATAKTLVGDWHLSEDLAVWHPDGYVEIKDRSKDIIISGAGCPACSSSSRTAPTRRTRPTWSGSADSTWPASRCRNGWCSAPSRRRRPAKSRNSPFARWRTRREIARPAPRGLHSMRERCCIT